MEASQIPAKFPVVWASGASGSYIRSIPTTTTTPGAASLTLGYPPVTFTDEAAGGIPMDGRDENGIFNQLSAWAQWQNMGGPVTYDGTFSSAIGGYPKGAWLMTGSGNGWWISLVDNNTSDPDTGGANWQLLQFGTTYAGNPNGNVAGVAYSQYGLTQALLWDTTNKILWLCTSTGPASGAGQAVWSQLTGSGSGTVWCGTSGGTGNAPILTPPNTLQALTVGTSLSWKVGASNGAGSTVQVGTFGTFPVKKGGPAGLTALAGGEMTTPNIVTGFYDGTNVVLTNIAFGTAAQANASSATGTVAAVTGTFSVGHAAVFSDTNGTLADGGVPGAATIIYLNASNNGQTFGSGIYNVDTNYSGAFSINLPSSPTLGACLDCTDISGTWATANFTINNNGNTIMGNATSLICNRSGEDFKIWWNGSDWRLA